MELKDVINVIYLIHPVEFDTTWQACMSHHFFSSSADNIEIFRAPRSQTVLISQNATFYCHGVADSVSWVIENNGTYLDSLSLSKQHQRGIIQGGIYVSSTEYNNSLTVLGTEENNQTMIHCVFFITSGPRNDTPVATLTVWGKVCPEYVFTY